MPLDPRIALGVQPLQMQSPMEGAQQYLTLRDLMESAAARGEKRELFQQQRQQMAAQQHAQGQFMQALQASGGQMTPQLATLGMAAGYDPAQLQQLSGMSNWGRPKVAGEVETIGPDGNPITMLRSEFGDPIGGGFRKPVQTRDRDLGTEIATVNPYTGAETGPRIAKSPEQTEVERLMIAQGIKPGSPQWNSTISGVLMKKSTHAPAANTTVYTGTMVPVEGPDGKPAYAMPAKDGTYTIAPGVRPPGTAAADEKAATDAASARDFINLIDMALAHPGRETATGLSGVIDPRNYTPGSPARTYMAIHKQLEGKAFLNAFNSLKGGGPITDVEGRKATEASVRLDTAQSDEAYAAALQEARGILNERYQRATGAPVPAQQGGASGNFGAPTPPRRRFNMSTGQLEDVK